MMSTKTLRFWNNYFKFGRVIILANIMFLTLQLVYTFIFIHATFPDFPIIYSLQLLIIAGAVLIVGSWLLRNIKNPIVYFVYFGLFIVFTILRNDHSQVAAVVKYFFRWIYPLYGIGDASPTFKYFTNNILSGGDAPVQDYLTIFTAYPVSMTWGIITSGFYVAFMFLTFLIHLSAAFRIMFIKGRVKAVKG
ncbi:MAG: hypothetical protein ACTSXU_05690, partial [Promethearchaeota archaeon]